MNESYDLLVIGSGPGGYVAAIKLQSLGKDSYYRKGRDWRHV